MRYPVSEKAEIIQLVEGSHLPAKRTLDKLGIPRATFYRGTSAIVKAGQRRWLTIVHDPIASGTAFPMLSVSRLSTWRWTFQNCRHASWRCASPTRDATSSRNPRYIACSRPMI